MRLSQLLLNTHKETPAEAQVISHRLMLRAGMIRKLASGLYTWLPLGLRVLRKVEAIAREEMIRAGAQELLMPILQPSELWEESGRWNKFGPLLMKMFDQKNRSFCLGPTHEEVVHDIIRHEINSYRQLPVNLFQIQTKFRDEIRPRFGVLRAREFLMKDGYSFHENQACLEKTYQRMYDAYSRVFDRVGLRYRAVLADSGNIGGNLSHEFHVLAETGEDAIFYSDESDYAANIELAPTLPSQEKPKPPRTAMSEQATPSARSVDESAKQLGISSDSVLKALIVKGSDVPYVMLLLRGNHTLNEIKAAKHPCVFEPFTLVTEVAISEHFKADAGSLGPINVNIPIIADYATQAMDHFACGANKTGFHYINVNWERDLPLPEFADLRNVEVGDPSPDGKGRLKMCRGIEIGHIFQVGDHYSKQMQVTALGKDGRPFPVLLGTYGIGISRIVGAAIEQNHDEKGIIWPEAITPFDISMIPINLQKSERLRTCCDQLYQQLLDAGFEVLFDDRNERPGVMFADSELMGIPHRLVISEKLLEKQTIEYKHRKESDSINIEWSKLFEFLRQAHNIK